MSTYQENGSESTQRYNQTFTARSRRIYQGIFSAAVGVMYGLLANEKFSTIEKGGIGVGLAVAAYVSLEAIGLQNPSSRPEQQSPEQNQSQNT